MVRSALFLLSGNAFGALMLFLRNLAVARLVSIEDYGIAATFAVSMAVAEMASGLGLQQMIVQDRAGGAPRFQAALQGFNLLRCLVSAGLLLLVAHPAARFLGIPQAGWAYQMLALVPLLRGFEHFDIYRLNRSMRFGPLIQFKTLPALVSLAAVWPLYRAFGDYRVMLYAMLLQWGLAVAVSHLAAERRFELAFDRAVMARCLRFGWPLLANNILMFAIFQGDKIIAGRGLGMAELAIFAMGMTLTLTPSLISAASEQSLFLPLLSNAAAQPERFSRLALAAMQTSLCSGLVLIAAVCLLGPVLVPALLGAKYAALLPLLPWLAVLQGLRGFKVGCTIVALSQAHTANAMIANGLRVLALPAAWLAVARGGGLQELIWIAAAGELCAFCASCTLAARGARLAPLRVLLPAGTALLAVAAAAWAAHRGLGAGVPPLWALAAAAVLLGLNLAAMKELRGCLSRARAA